MTIDPPRDDSATPSDDTLPDVVNTASPSEGPGDNEGASAPDAAAPAAAPAESASETAEESQVEGEGQPTTAVAEPPAEPAPEAKPSNKRWYVVKVQSGREESVKEAIERRVKIEGLEQYFGQVVVPMERETITIQSGKRKGQKTVKKKKKFPGYIMAEVEYNEQILYLFRETSGVGDFVGGSLNKPPAPMSDREVDAMLRDQDDYKGAPLAKEPKKKGAAPVKLPFSVGDKVRVRDGIFAGQEGEIKDIREPKDDTETHRISVELTVFGRPTRVQLEHWQIENA